MNRAVRARRIVEHWAACRGLTLDALSKMAGRNRAYLAGAFSDNRGHCAVLALRDIVPFTPDVLEWAESVHKERRPKTQVIDFSIASRAWR